MASIIFRDDFDGSGPMLGRAPNINPMAGQLWSDNSAYAGALGTVLGGYVTTAAGSPNPSACRQSIGTVSGGIGLPTEFEANWSWTAPPLLSDIAAAEHLFNLAVINNSGPSYPSADIQPTGSGNALISGGFVDGATSVAVTPGQTYEGRLLCTSGRHELEFFGQTLVGSEPLTEDIGIWRVVFFLGYGSKLNHLSIQEAPDPNGFWTRFVNTKEVIA